MIKTLHNQADQQRTPSQTAYLTDKNRQYTAFSHPNTNTLSILHTRPASIHLAIKGRSYAN